MKETIKYPKFRWFVMLTMLISTVAGAATLIAPAPLMGEIANELGVNLGVATGAIMAIYTLAFGISGIIGGVLVDKLGIVRVYIGSLVLMIVGSLLIPVLGNTLGAIVLLRIVQGFGAGPVASTITRVAAEWFPAKERGLITGVNGMSAALGVAVGLGVSPAIFAATSSWRAAMAGISVISFIGLAMTVVVALGPKSPDAAIASETSSSDEGLIGKALRQPVTLVCLLCFSVVTWVFMAFNDLTPGYLAIQPPVGIGKGPVIAGQIMMIFQFAYMAGALASGFILDRIFAGSVKRTVQLSYLLSAIFVIFLKFPAIYLNGTLLMTFLILTGFFMGTSGPVVLAFIARNYPEHITGRVGGMVTGIGIFGGTIGVTVGSTALRATGNYQLSIIIVGLVAFLGFLIAFGLKAPKFNTESTTNLERTASN